MSWSNAGGHQEFRRERSEEEITSTLRCTHFLGQYALRDALCRTPRSLERFGYRSCLSELSPTPPWLRALEHSDAFQSSSSPPPDQATTFCPLTWIKAADLQTENDFPFKSSTCKSKTLEEELCRKCEVESPGFCRKRAHPLPPGSSIHQNHWSCRAVTPHD